MKDKNWQKPYVNIFKKYEILKKFEKKGKVTEKFETQIGRRIFEISGNISISNYLDIKNFAENKNLDLIGKYIYFSFFAKRTSNFFFIIDLLLADNNKIILTISNKFKKIEKKENRINIPFSILKKNNIDKKNNSDSPNSKKTEKKTEIQKIDKNKKKQKIEKKSKNQKIDKNKKMLNNEKWTILRLDLESLFEKNKIYPLYNIKRVFKHEILKIRVCSVIKLRGIFTSDIGYDEKSFPEDFGFVKKKKWSDFYDFIIYEDFEENLRNDFNPKKLMKNKTEEIEVVKNNNFCDLKNDNFEGFGKLEKNKENFYEKIEMNNYYLEKKNKNNQLNESDYLFLQTEKQIKNNLKSTKKKIEKIKINLKKIIGFTGKFCPDIKFYFQNNINHLIYISGKIIIITNLQENSQKFIKSHTNAISCFDIKNNLLISSQIGENPLTVIHDLTNLEKIEKTKFFPILKNIRTVSISKSSEYVTMVGESKITKDLILVYKLNKNKKKSSNTNKNKKKSSNPKKNKKTQKTPSLISKHTSNSEILCLKCSPLDENRLTTCGRENIKFFRLKKTHLSSQPVILTKFTRNTTFTIFDYSLNTKILPSSKIIAGSKTGQIFIINYNSANLEKVLKITNNPLLGLSVNAGFCATFGGDGFLRIWPLDFSEFFFEADFAEFGISADFSSDGVFVAVATKGGFLGVVDLRGMEARRVVCAHEGRVLAMDFFGGRVLSLGEDFCVKVWEEGFGGDGKRVFLKNRGFCDGSFNQVYNDEEGDLIRNCEEKRKDFFSLEKNKILNEKISKIENVTDYKEIYRFNFCKDDECTCILFITKDTFAAGFNSGFVRIFSISSTKVIKEISRNRNKIIKIVKSQNNRFLIIADTDGIFAILDIQNNFDIIKYLKTDKNKKNEKNTDSKISCSIDQLDRFLAILGGCGNFVEFFDLDTFEKIFSFNIGCFVHTVKFCKINKNEVIFLSFDGSFKIYEILFLENPENQNFLKNPEFSEEDFFNKQNNLGISERKNLGRNKKIKLRLKKVAKKCHENYISDIIDLKNGFYCTSGGDGFLKIWENGKNKKLELVKILEEHNNSIYNIMFDFEKNLIFSAGGNEGIFIWKLNFFENNQIVENSKNLEIEDFLDENCEKIEFDKVLEKNDFDKNENMIDSDTYNFIEDIYDLKNQKNFSLNNKCEKQLKSEKKAKKSILEENNNKTINFLEEIKYIKKENYNLKKNKNNSPKKNFSKFKNNLTYNHYLEENSQKYLPNFEKIKKRKNFLLKKIIGINIHSINNLIWNIKNSTIIFFFENKLIFEKLEKNQNQKIFHFEELISGIFITKNYDFLFVATSVKNSKGFSPIYKIYLKNYKIEKIDFCEKGVQFVDLSEDCKYMICIGNFLDKKIGIFKMENNLEENEAFFDFKQKNGNFEVKEQGKIENGNFELVYEFQNLEIANCANIYFSKKFKNYYFFISNKEKITVLRLDTKMKKIEKLDLFVNFENSENFDITCFLTFSLNSQNYLFIGTKNGDLIIYNFYYFEKFEKNCFKKLYEKKIENSEIIFLKKSEISKKVIFSTTGKNLYYFNYENFLKDFNINFDFKKIQFSSIVTNITLDKNFEEGLILQQNEKIKYINLKSEKKKTENFTKLISSQNQIFKIIKIKIQKKKFLLIIFNNGKVSIYNYKNLEFYKNLKISSTISFAIYLKSKKTIFLTTQEQEIFLINCENDFFEKKYFKIENLKKMKKGYFKKIY